MVGVAVLGEGELAQDGVEVLDAGERLADILALAALGDLDRLGHDVDAGVGLGGELVGVAVVFGLVVLDEILALGVAAGLVPGRADDQALAGLAGVLNDGRRVEAIAADDRH